ncbi:hypothetical protein FDA94_12160 [Herbidospora galbida]|uniref:Transposase n=1 Tax=Herbidospora galbida TaxID=2575442 RepID=A0A4U3MJG0_9ACTN|nr:hypothetical protein FDA94_12160 [Herbidospora galbida]
MFTPQAGGWDRAAERCINQIKAWRGPAFRFDKTPAGYLAGLHLRGAILWIRSLPTPLKI